MRDGERRKVRFAPDEGAIAQIDPTIREDNADFEPKIQALVIDEARDGCGLVVVNNKVLFEGDTCLVKIGDLDPLISEIRWVQELDEDVQKIGVMYLE